jgi:hypothetical protein
MFDHDHCPGCECVESGLPCCYDGCAGNADVCDECHQEDDDE